MNQPAVPPPPPPPASHKGINVVERAKNILLTPKNEWAIVDKETYSVGTIAASYILPMLAIGVLATFIGTGLIGVNGFTSIKLGLIGALMYVVSTFILVFILAAVIEGLAPSFGSGKDWNKSFQIAAFSLTPAYVGGIFFLVPALGILVIICTVYSIYPLYTGILVMKKPPADKEVGYLAVVVLIGIIAVIVIGLIETEIIKAFNRPTVGIGGRGLFG
jgi:Yip1 domain